MCNVLVNPVCVWIIHILNYANLVHQMFRSEKHIFNELSSRWSRDCANHFTSQTNMDSPHGKIKTRLD